MFLRLILLMPEPYWKSGRVVRFFSFFFCRRLLEFRQTEGCFPLFSRLIGIHQSPQSQHTGCLTDCFSVIHFGNSVPHATLSLVSSKFKFSGYSQHNEYIPKIFRDRVSFVSTARESRETRAFLSLRNRHIASTTDKAPPLHRPCSKKKKKQTRNVLNKGDNRYVPRTANIFVCS